MAAPFLGRGGEFPCRIDPPCIESVVPSDAVDASADEEQRDGEQRQNREDKRQPRALRQRVEVKVEMLALTTGPCADAGAKRRGLRKEIAIPSKNDYICR